MKRLAAVIVGLAALVGIWLLYAPTPTDMKQPLSQITVGETTLQVELANTDALRQQGLSGRTSPGADRGMLFVFDQDGQWGIWMKDMRFAIDIIWLDADGTVVWVEPSVAPDTYPKVFTPPVPARYVLELPAGFVHAQGLARGDIVSL